MKQKACRTTFMPGTKKGVINFGHPVRHYLYPVYSCNDNVIICCVFSQDAFIAHFKNLTRAQQQLLDSFEAL